MNPFSSLDLLDGTRMETRPTRRFPGAASLDKLSLGVGREVRWSRVNTVDETAPDSQDPDERPARRHRWYRPSLVG